MTRKELRENSLGKMRHEVFSSKAYPEYIHISLHLTVKQEITPTVRALKECFRVALGNPSKKIKIERDPKE